MVPGDYQQILTLDSSCIFGIKNNSQKLILVLDVSQEVNTRTLSPALKMS